MRFSRGATINNVIPVIIKRKNEHRKTGKPPSREKETVRVGEKKREKEALENGGVGDRKGKEQANPAEKQRARVRKRERDRGTAAMERIALEEDIKTEKNRAKRREKEEDRGRIKGSGRGRWRARKTRSRVGQKD